MVTKQEEKRGIILPGKGTWYDEIRQGPLGEKMHRTPRREYKINQLKKLNIIYNRSKIKIYPFDKRKMVL